MLSTSSRLSEILFEYPELITVVNRFGISLGVGDKSIDELCRESNTDSAFVTALLNICLGNESAETANLGDFDSRQLAQYLYQTNNYYRDALLPNIERHLNSLVNHSSEADNLDLLRKFFYEAKRDLLDVLQEDISHLSPPVDKGLHSDSITIIEKGTATADKFFDLANFFVKHLKGEYDHNLCRGVVTAILTLYKDLNTYFTLRGML